MLMTDNLDRYLDEFTAEAARAPAAAEGVLLSPFFNGERTPALPWATASLTGLSAANCTRANLCRAAFEGPVLGLHPVFGPNMPSRAWEYR